ncbi:hypothetical protein SAMN04488590_3201 [Microbacterium sp. 77mftsu3.1]|nr:hypothetical protein SAMN04488590_3201 [Microbacterium sp. 77mftsu3.1]
MRWEDNTTRSMEKNEDSEKKYVAAIAALAIMTMTLFSVTPAHAAQPDGTVTLERPIVKCTELSSEEIDYSTILGLLQSGPLDDIRDVIKAHLIKAASSGGTAFTPTTHLNAFEAQLSWPEVDGATGYLVRAPYASDTAPVDAYPTWSPSGEIRHTLAPDGVSPMPHSYWWDQGGYTHLTFYVFAVNPAKGLSSEPAIVHIRVTSNVANPDLGDPLANNYVRMPAATCGHDGAEPRQVALPASAEPPFPTMVTPEPEPVHENVISCEPSPNDPNAVDVLFRMPGILPGELNPMVRVEADYTSTEPVRFIYDRRKPEIEAQARYTPNPWNHYPQIAGNVPFVVTMKLVSGDNPAHVYGRVTLRITPYSFGQGTFIPPVTTCLGFARPD